MAKRNRTDTAIGRKALPPRREPYWHKLASRRYLGFRKTGTGATSWIARYTNVDGKYLYHALGAFDDGPGTDPFGEASAAATAWFGTLSCDDVPRARYTLKNCIDDYVEHLRVERTEKTALDTEQRLLKHTGEKLLNTPVTELHTRQLKAWRDAMVKQDPDPEIQRRSKDSANRVASMMKAALNLAFRSGLVPDDTTWRRLEAFRGVGQARILFLTDKQVDRLLAKSTGALHTLIKAGVLLGARYGELTASRVADFDAREGTLVVSGKTGKRTMYLSTESAVFLRQVASGKLPTAFLFSRDDGHPWGKSELQRPFRLVVSKAKLPRDTVYYSLRHYHISKALLAGLPMQVVAENTGTSVRMIEKHYGKFLASDRRALMDTVQLGVSS